MKIYQLKRNQLVNSDIETCWSFFCAPQNLKEITPEFMGFDIVSNLQESMYEGMVIEYIVRPVLNIPMRWLTEITHVKELDFFVDEQRVGPYRLWHHEHHFKKVSGGVEMTDIVTYALPFGFLGSLFHPVISKKLNQIFDYRYKAIEKKFN